MKPSSYVVILCGGSGTRLWPASRPSSPKQFTNLISSESLFQHTARRAISSHADRKLLIVAGRSHESIILGQREQAGLNGSILIEPEARDSGPAIAAAAAHISAISPEAVMFVLASDHYIPDADAFNASLAVAEQAAHNGLIATLGVLPTHPSTAYGYIRPSGAPVENHAASILEFREKPDHKVAEQFVRDGYLWNSGNFVAKATTLLDAFEAFEPQLAAAARLAASEVKNEGEVSILGPSFSRAKKISIDFAVMERATNTCVVPVGWKWSDLGAWDAVYSVSRADEEGNVRSGDTVIIDTNNSLIQAKPGITVATVGISNLAVIAEQDAVLVCHLDAAQSVKQIVEEIKRRGLSSLDIPAESKLRPLCVQSEELKNWLFNSALPLWWCIGADHERGGFRELIGLNAAPTGEFRRCRVQSRQAYVYASAGRMGWSGPWASAVHHAFTELETAFLRPDGLYRTRVDNRGLPLDETAKLYDQAFVLLALSAAQAVMPDAEAKALALLDRLQSYRHAGGGYSENEPEAFQSNPHMHVFEACLAWIEAGGSPIWKNCAAEIAQLACARFIVPETGALYEFFDAEWQPLSWLEGQRIEPGHQFEWAWLLERWSRLSGDHAAGSAARQIFSIGTNSIDRQRQVAINAIGQGYTAIDSGARLWPQTEWLKAAQLFSGGPDDVPGASPRDVMLALASTRRYLDTAVSGLWRDKMRPEGGFVEEPAPASSLYHIAGAILAIQPANAG